MLLAIRVIESRPGITGFTTMTEITVELDELRMATRSVLTQMRWAITGIRYFYNVKTCRGRACISCATKGIIPCRSCGAIEFSLGANITVSTATSSVPSPVRAMKGIEIRDLVVRQAVIPRTVGDLTVRGPADSYQDTPVSDFAQKPALLRTTALRQAGLGSNSNILEGRSVRR